MHMRSKKELTSEEMSTVKRYRNPAVVLIAYGDVHTHEETQMFVHGLGEFVTMQLLEETLALLSLVSGREPRLTKHGKKHYLQNGQLRTSRRSRVICSFWEQFVSYIAITGLVEKRGRNSSWIQHATCFMFTFRFSIRTK